MKRFLIQSAETERNLAKKCRDPPSLEYSDTDVDDPLPTTAVERVNADIGLPSEDTFKSSYLFDGELYNIVSVDGIKLSAKCAMCSKVINGHKTSTGNFLSHMKLKHKYMYSKLLAKKDAKKKKGNVQLVTNNLLEKKQLKLSFSQNSEVSKEKVKNLIFNYIVEEMKPLITCEKPSFKSLIQGLTSDNIVLPHRRVLANELRIRYKSYVNMLTESIDKQHFICVTADIWSSNNKSYLGMTCHYINENNYQRHSYVLACKRIKGNHTYLNIGKVITQIMQDYKINNDKVSHIITDNASNFSKAFRTFSNQYLIATKDATVSDPNYLGILSSEDSDSDNENMINSDTENDSDSPSIENIDFSSMNLDSNFISLPNHITCAAHSLNLIATNDIDVSKIENESYNKISKAAFQKLFSFWNLLSRSTVASDKVTDLCNCKFPVPVITRWNSMYTAVQKVVSHKDVLVLVFDELKISKLKKSEWIFLSEYSKVMGPLAISLDKLQGEKSCYLGYVAPTLLALRLMMIKMNNLVYCRSLCLKIISSIEKRFDYIIDLKKVKSNPYILSAVSHPKFKLTWVPERYRSYCKQLFLEECASVGTSIDDECNKEVDLDSNSSDQDFFQVLSEVTSTTLSNSNLEVSEDGQRNQRISNVQALSYLNLSDKDLTVLDSFSTVKKVFINHNTTLPSSAPVERLFSSGSQIMTPRRNRLNDKTFEMLLCCRCLLIS